MKTPEELQARIDELEAGLGLKPATNTAYIIEMTEYERGWGQRPDGYLAFKDQQLADAYVRRETAGRGLGNVPDEYVGYSTIGLKPVSAAVAAKIATAKDGYLYINKLKELLV